MGKNGWVLIFLLVTSAYGQVQMLTTDKQGNVLNPTGANFPSAIPLKINGTAFQSAPGISKYYGMDGTGTLGYFGLPNSAVWGLITGTLSNQTDLQNALNAKQNTLTLGNLTDAGTDGITVTGGTGAVVGSGTSLSQHVADGTHNGYLSSTDWNTFSSGSAGGTVTNIATTSPITGGPITTTGTIGLNVGVDHSFTAAQSITISDSSPNTVAYDVLSVGHHLTSGTTLAGFGVGMRFGLDDTAVTNQTAGEINVWWSNPTHNSVSSQMDFALRDGTLIQTKAKLFSSGGFSVNNTVDPGAGIISANTGFKIGSTEFPIASNGIPIRTAANTWSVLTIGTGLNLTGTTLAVNTPTPTPTPNTTATFTPTATATATATNTPTPSATSTPTPTPTPTPIGTGISLEDSNGVFQSLITTSAGVASAITDETGTAGSLVFSTSPALSGTPSSTNLAITGTAGAGYLTMVAQSSNPSAPAAGTLLLHSSTVQGFTRMEQDNEATTNLVYGRDNVFIAKNVNAGTIAKGQVVYNTTTSTGAVPNIDLAKADSATTLPALGVALDSIAANAFGQIMVAGVVDSFNTNSFATGDELYVSPTTAGALQKTMPTAVGQFQQRVGSVLNKGIGNGSMLIDVAPFVTPVQIMMKSVTFVVDGGGIVLGTGTKNPVKIPFGGTLLGWTTMCKPSCSITMDVFRAADGAGLPVTSIVGGSGTKPFITTAVENKGTDFSNWTSTVLTANDNLAISLSGITAATYVELTLFYK